MIKVPSFSRYYKVVRRPTKEQANKITLTFNNWVMYFLIEEIHQQFIIKSKGGIDSLGVKWKPLAESTRIYKSLQRGEKTKYGIGRRKGTKKVLLADRTTPINIDTKRLVNSLKPGVVSNGIYYSNNVDQEVTVTTHKLSLNIRVPYADDVQEVRPYLPVSLTPWLEKAIEKALPKLRVELVKNVLI